MQARDRVVFCFVERRAGERREKEVVEVLLDLRAWLSRDIFVNEGISTKQSRGSRTVL